MEKYQKQVQIELLAHEEDIKQKLASNYRAALKDVRAQLEKMMFQPDFDKDSTYYKYPKMMEAKLQTILHSLGDKNVEDMEGYLQDTYIDAYLGCLYGIHHDGVGLILQVDEKKVETTIQQDTKGLKFSERIYKNVDSLKQDVINELARGFSSGMDYASIARQIALRAGISQKRANTLARTEGHRVENEAKSQCMHDARDRGADVLKQWDSTLDNVTRDTHRELDGQIRELDEPFVIQSSGAKAMRPGGFGIAKEDVNCRCCMLQRARWALGEDEYKYSREQGNIICLRSEVYKEWKNLYNKVRDLLFSRAPVGSESDTIDDEIRMLKLINKLPTKVAKVLTGDIEYNFGGSENKCNPFRKVIYYARGVKEDEMLHEMGHILEYEFFDENELRNFKKRFVSGSSRKDIVKRTYYKNNKKDFTITLLKNNKFLTTYQGRLYNEDGDQPTVLPDGTINVDIMHEFLSESIPMYFLDPEGLRLRSPELYDFVSRRLR